MSSLRIRAACAEDYEHVARLVPELMVGDPIPSREKFVGEMVQHTLIAESAEAVLGYALWHHVGDSALARHVVTAPEARRQGLGRALVQEIVERAKGASCTTAALNVLPSNHAAIALYTSLGFELGQRAAVLRFPWAQLERLAASGCLARVVVSTDDERVETTLSTGWPARRGPGARHAGTNSARKGRERGWGSNLRPELSGCLPVSGGKARAIRRFAARFASARAPC